MVPVRLPPPPASELREDFERRLLERLAPGGDALKQEGKELRPLALLEDARGELANRVAHLVRDGLDGLLLQALQQLALDAVLGLRLQVGPQGHLVLGQDAAEEDGGHLARLRRLAGAERAHQLQAQHVGLLLALVEDGLVLLALGVVDAGEPAEQLLEGCEGVHVQHRRHLRGGYGSHGRRCEEVGGAAVGGAVRMDDGGRLVRGRSAWAGGVAATRLQLFSFGEDEIRIVSSAPRPVPFFLARVLRHNSIVKGGALLHDKGGVACARRDVPRRVTLSGNSVCCVTVDRRSLEVRVLDQLSRFFFSIRKKKVPARRRPFSDAFLLV